MNAGRQRREWFGYSVELAAQALRRSPVATVLIVLVLALGLGATVTAIAVMRILSADPLPGRSDSLYVVQLPSLSQRSDNVPDPSGTWPDTVSWTDAAAMLASIHGVAQTAVVDLGPLALQTGAHGRGRSATAIVGLAVTNEFFSMFDVPLVHGTGWSLADEEAHAPLAVISSHLSARLFATENSVGESIEVNGIRLRVVGVSGAWKPQPHFYALDAWAFGGASENVFVPLNVARETRLPIMGKVQCAAGVAPSRFHPNAANCQYLNFWARLDAHGKAAYLRHVQAYASGDTLSVHANAETAKISSVADWLGAHHVVTMAARLGLWLALSFFVVCLVNASGMLLTKAMRRSSEIGIRRALGASRLDIYMQHLFEAGFLALIGCGIALPFVWAGMSLVRLQAVAYAPDLGLGWTNVGLLLGFTVLTSMAVGILPAWRASALAPALQAKGG